MLSYQPHYQQVSFQQAINLAIEKKLRLPTREEIKKIFKKNANAHDIIPYGYWTSDFLTFEGDSVAAWAVDFDDCFEYLDCADKPKYALFIKENSCN